MELELELIRSIVEKKTGVDISKKTRKRHVVNARYFYYTLCKETTMSSLEFIGKTLGFHHCSVLHGIKTFKETILMCDRNYKHLYNSTKISLTSKTNRKDKELRPGKYYKHKFSQLINDHRDIVRIFRVVTSELGESKESIKDLTTELNKCKKKIDNLNYELNEYKL